MEKIFYRVWDIENCFMTEPVGMTFSGSGAPYVSWEYQNALHNGMHGLSCVLMLWTGRLDKNGKKIFEGDICNGLGVVEYNPSLTWDGGGSDHPGFYFSKAYLFGDFGELEYNRGFDDREIEIVGNLYENPELAE